MAFTDCVSCPRPRNVGIVAIDVYFPTQYVEQVDLEKHDGVGEGKYTIGLGQRRMGIVTDREDTHALCLSVINNLMDKSGIDWKDIGHLEVGTETIIDKSKSIKTVLLQLWDKYDPGGNRDIEGVDAVNACYGGTAALYHAVNWIESSAWDGRYAMVVMADIAVYGPGNGRPTSGAGAVAMIIGPNAPLAVEQGTRSTYVENAYDFYKPELDQEYPFIDGKLSVDCYVKALDQCYSRFSSKVEKCSPGTKHSLVSFDYMLFHCPYVKLVQKSFARMGFCDFLRACVDKAELEPFKNLKLQDTYNDKNLERAAVASFNADFAVKTEPSTRVASEVGNMYTAALYACLCSLLHHTNPADLAGKRIGMFSYGSGLAASMFALRVTPDIDAVRKMSRIVADISSKLESRTRCSPEYFHEALNYRNEIAHKAPFHPRSPVTDLHPRSWYLVEVDEKHRRKYERRE